MGSSYKVRLADGSEIGPLDRAMLRSWYEQGLIADDSLVLGPGAPRWSGLARVVDVSGWKRPGAARPRAPRAPSATPPAPAGAAGIRLEPRRAALYAGAVAAVLVAAFGVARLLAPASGEARELAEWTADDQRFTDASLGVALDAGGSWRLLLEGNPLVPAPAQARATFAEPRAHAAAFLLVDGPRGLARLDHYLDRIGADRRRGLPGRRELGRSDVTIGSLAGRRSVARWDAADGVRHAEWTTVWSDGWSYLALVAWAPESRAEAAASAVDALLRGFASNGTLAAQLRHAVERTVAEVPHLTPEAASLIMGQSEARVLEPEETFRRACEAAASSLRLLGADEVREMGQLSAATYAPLGAGERTRLASYLDRVRARQLTTPEEDRAMSQLVKRGVMKLPEARRARLRALYERAIQAVIQAG
jgi:hypothetical protein